MKSDTGKQRYHIGNLAFVHASKVRCVKRRLHTIACFILFTKIFNHRIIVRVITLTV